MLVLDTAYDPLVLSGSRFRRVTHALFPGRPLETIAGARVVVPFRPRDDWKRILDLGWFELDTELFLTGVLCPGMTVIDVGAHHGTVAVLAGKLVGPEGRVIAFEPDPDSREVLQRVTAANGLRNVTVETSPVAAAPGPVVYPAADAPYGSKRTLDGVSLDAYCEKHGVAPDVMKIDVDGPELAVLEGATHILARHRPLLTVEISFYQLELGIRPAQIIDFLRDAGYTLFATRMKFPRPLPVERETDLLQLPVELEKREAANLFAFPDPPTSAEVQRLWPPELLPDAYERHFLSGSGYPSGADFWQAFQTQLTAAARERRSAARTLR